MRGMALALAGALAACGQKGPLLLPTGAAAQERATLPQTIAPSSSLPAPPASGAGFGTASPTPPNP